MTELPEMLLDEAMARLPPLREAVEEGGTEQVEKTSHTLKGSSGNMGATRMAEICAQQQDAGASRDLERAPELLGRLEVEFERVRVALEESRECNRGSWQR